MRKVFSMRGKAFLACAVALALLSSACPGGWELGVYRTLATVQVNYHNVYAAVVELHLRGQIPEERYAQAQLIANRIYTLGQTSTAMMVSYRTIKDDVTKRRIDSVTAELPKLVAELLALVDAIRKRPSAAPATQQERREIGEKLDRIEAELDVLEVLE